MRSVSAGRARGAHVPLLRAAQLMPARPSRSTLQLPLPRPRRPPRAAAGWPRPSASRGGLPEQRQAGRPLPWPSAAPQSVWPLTTYHEPPKAPSVPRAPSGLGVGCASPCGPGGSTGRPGGFRGSLRRQTPLNEAPGSFLAPRWHGDSRPQSLIHTRLKPGHEGQARLRDADPAHLVTCSNV